MCLVDQWQVELLFLIVALMFQCLCLIATRYRGKNLAIKDNPRYQGKHLAIKDRIFVQSIFTNLNHCAIELNKLKTIVQLILTHGNN